jgi:hypothetical protein
MDGAGEKKDGSWPEKMAEDETDRQLTVVLATF